VVFYEHRLEVRMKTAQGKHEQDIEDLMKKFTQRSGPDTAGTAEATEWSDASDEVLPVLPAEPKLPEVRVPAVARSKFLEESPPPTEATPSRQSARTAFPAQEVAVVKRPERRLGTGFAVVGTTGTGVGCISFAGTTTTHTMSSDACSGTSGKPCAGCFIATADNNDKSLKIHQCSTAKYKTGSGISGTGYVMEISIINADTNNKLTVIGCSTASTACDTTVSTYVLGPSQSAMGYCYAGGSDAIFFNGLSIGTATAASYDFTGTTIASINVDSGAIDGTTVGANSAETGAFTTLSATGDLTIGGGDVVASSTTAAVNVFATTTGTLTLGDGVVNIGKTGSTTTVDGALAVGQNSVLDGDLEIGGGDVTASSTTAAVNVFATTTGTLTLGGGVVNIAAANAATAVDGSLTVAQATTLSGALTVSSDATINLNNGADVAATKTANFVATSHATNQVNLPDASVAGQIYIVCNNHATAVIVGTANNNKIVDGAAAAGDAGSLRQYQCRQFVGDGTSWLAVNSQYASTTQAAVADCAANIPADGAITNPPNQADVEELRDAVAELQTQLNAALARLRLNQIIA